jgi:hypothetical protein
VHDIIFDGDNKSKKASKKSKKRRCIRSINCTVIGGVAKKKIITVNVIHFEESQK